MEDNGVSQCQDISGTEARPPCAAMYISGFSFSDQICGWPDLTWEQILRPAQPEAIRDMANTERRGSGFGSHGKMA